MGQSINYLKRFKWLFCRTYFVKYANTIIVVIHTVVAKARTNICYGQSRYNWEVTSLAGKCRRQWPKRSNCVEKCCYETRFVLKFSSLTSRQCNRFSRLVFKDDTRYVFINDYTFTIDYYCLFVRLMFTSTSFKVARQVRALVIK